MKELKLSLESLLDRISWEEQGFRLPAYDIEAVRAKTRKEPQWIHFGPGNIFRAFPARVQDELLDQGLADRGVIIAESFGAEKLDHIFNDYDNLSTAVTLKADGSVEARVVGCIAETLKAGPNYDPADWERLCAIFRSESLQVVSSTITEKGYNLKDSEGEFRKDVQAEFSDSDCRSSNVMGILAALLYERFQAGAYPITLMSMDNVSHNGSLMRASVLDYAKAWVDAGFMPKEFFAYVNDTARVSFPWSMIDKITPAADSSVGEILRSMGYQDVEGALMNGRALPPSFANAEETEYLVTEDVFPNGRPAWEKGGVLFTDRETVDRVETMKVTTCLNPLHTALAVYGCLLDYEKIHAEMKDEDLVNLIHGVGYVEGLPVVVDPKILNPKEFIDTVIGERFPNTFMPDAPQRIATDTSQKVGIRYGKTLAEYSEKRPEELRNLVYIPAVLAGWLRYLMAVNDEGQAFTPSPDPLLDELQAALAGLKLGETENAEAILRPILENENIFAVNLTALGLTDKVIANFKQLAEGPGAIRRFLQSLPRAKA